MNRLVKYTLAIIILIIGGQIAQAFLSGPDPKKEMTKLVQEMNRGLPKKIDPYTTLTKAEFQNNVYRIHYTMDPDFDLDPTKRDAYRKAAISQICSSNMKIILQHKVTIEYLYTYSSATGQQKMPISVPPGSCG